MGKYVYKFSFLNIKLKPEADSTWISTAFASEDNNTLWKKINDLETAFQSLKSDNAVLKSDNAKFKERNVKATQALQAMIANNLQTGMNNFSNCYSYIVIYKENFYFEFSKHSN